MPLRVHCPQGCLIRVPNSRAGKVVRCPGCKSVIRLPDVSASELANGKPIPIHALPANTTDSQISDFVPYRDDQPVNLNQELDQGKQKPGSPTHKATGETPHQAGRVVNVPFERPTPVVPKKRLVTPAPTRRKIPSADEPVDFSPPAVLDQEPLAHSMSHPSDGTHRPKTFLQEPEDGDQMLRQFQASTSDRIVLARFYSICVFCTGIFNLIPAIYFWYYWGHIEIEASWPRWAYLQIFVAGLHFIYAIFLYQIPDWSTLRTIAIAMLVFAMMYGLVSSGLLIGGGHGTIANFLRLPSALLNQAAIWCVAMLCLSTLISYLTGKESALWCRTEKLLNQILTGQN